MFNTSSVYRELMAQPSRILSARGLIIYPDTAQQALTAQHISGFSVIEDAGDHIPLGSAAAATVTLKLDNRAGEWNKGGSIRGNHALEGAEVRLELGVWDGADFVWENIGRYVLEDAIGQEQEPLIELKGMDYLGNKAQRAFIDDLAYPMTLAEMADAACFQAGITRKTQTFINSAVVISTRPEWDGDISCRDALAQIAACAGGFARIDRNGELEIVTLSSTLGGLAGLYQSHFEVDEDGYLTHVTPDGYTGPEFSIIDDELSVDQDDVVRINDDGEVEVIAFYDGDNYFISPSRYKRLTRQAESFGPLNAITFKGRAASESSPEIAPLRLAVNAETADTALNSIGIEGNALLLPGTASFNALKDGLTGALFGLSFAGASLTWQGDQTVTNGDGLIVIDLKGNQETVIITKNALNFSSGFEMISGNRLKGNAESGTNSSKQRIFTPDGKINAEAISGVIKRLQIAIGAIGEAQIDDASITVAKMKTATIEALTAAALSAVTARIQYLIANELVTDELYAALAEIATAEIGTAEIDWAKIKDLVSGRQIFTEGAGGKLYIADLAVTEANMVSLTVGELIVRGADGRFYAVSVDGEGQITTELKQIADGDIEDEGITGSTKIIERSVTADRLNATDIFADNAIIRQLMAANLDVDTFFAREGVVNKLTLDYVQPLNDAITIKLNEQAIYTGPVAPPYPPVDKMWVDTSTSPERMKRWTGTEWAVVSKSKTDGYISMGTIKMPGGGTEFGVAVGEGVDTLDVDGEIPTTERSMSVQTAKAYMILTGGEQVFDVDATGADAKSFRGESVVIDGAWVQTTTPTKGFVLKWGG